MKKVTGIGGIFFKAKDAFALAERYNDIAPLPLSNAAVKLLPSGDEACFNGRRAQRR